MGNLHRPKAAEDDPLEQDQTTADDTEGHTMLLDPSAMRQLARTREQEVERSARERQRQKEARGR